MAILINLDVILAKREMKSNELAEKIGITTANLSILKTGKAKAIRFSTLEAIAEIELWQKTVEFLNAPKMLQVFNTTGAVAKLVNDARHRMMFAGMRGLLVQGVIEPALESLVIVALGTAIVITYLVLGDGAAESLPEIFVYLLVIVRVKPQIVALNQVRLRIAGLLPRIVVVEEFLATAEKSPQRTGGIQVNGLTDKIRFENVDFRYSETGVNVLNDITFEVPKRTTVAITGTSGAGKSSENHRNSDRFPTAFRTPRLDLCELIRPLITF